MYMKIFGFIVIFMIVFTICQAEPNIDPFLTDFGTTPFDGVWEEISDTGYGWMWINTKRDSIFVYGFVKETGFAMSISFKNILIKKNILTSTFLDRSWVKKFEEIAGEKIPAEVRGRIDYELVGDRLFAIIEGGEEQDGMQKVNPLSTTEQFQKAREISMNPLLDAYLLETLSNLKIIKDLEPLLNELKTAQPAQSSKPVKTIKETVKDDSGEIDLILEDERIWDSIDAVFYKEDGKAFMFKGDEYIRYDIKIMKRDPGYPKKIIDGFKGLTFVKDIDSVFYREDGKVFFFKGDEYIRYDIKTVKCDEGYPKKIIDGFQRIFANY